MLSDKISELEEAAGYGIERIEQCETASPLKHGPQARPILGRSNKDDQNNNVNVGEEMAVAIIACRRLTGH